MENRNHSNAQLRRAAMFSRTKLCTGLVIAFGGLAIAPGAVFAQDSTSLGRVEITGSAIKRLDAETAVPITVIKFDDLKKEGVTTIEQVMTSISSSQTLQSTSQVVGAGTGGASFADLRGVGANKTLVLLNGRRVANNALDSSAPDLNMIPFAAIDRIEVLRDGASSLYGTDAIGGVINFITRKNYTGGSITVGAESPQHPGGKSKSANFGFGFGDLNTSGFNVFGFIDYLKQDPIGGKERDFNTRYAGGLSPTTSPANYFQGGDSGNPAAPACTSAPNLIPNSTNTGCQMTTSSFVNYTPTTERLSGLLKGTIKINNDNQLGLEYFASRSKISTVIAPVPYGGLFMNILRPDGSLNPYYPGNTATSITPNIPLSATFTDGSAAAHPELQPGYIHVKWRDLPNGSRQGITTNDQQRLVASLEGSLGAWDYSAAATYNENKINDGLAGYSNGPMITAAVLNGVINPFGAQDAAGQAVIDNAGLAGTLQTAKGTVTGIDGRASRELGDWLNTGRRAAVAVGAEIRHESFRDAAEVDFATKVIASTGFDPGTLNEGSRSVDAVYGELNVPILNTLDVTLALRHDRYSDFGSTTNPKASFRFQPNQQVLVRGSYSTGFRAPSLYEINAAPYYTNTGLVSDPVNCPGGTPIPGKSSSANCNIQAQALYGGNTSLQPETSKNLTLGLVFEPTKDLSLGVDLWSIKVDHAIGSISFNTVFANSGTFAGLFHRNPSGDLSTDGSECPNPLTCGYVDLRTQNLGGTNTNGVDLSANYRLRAGTAGDFRFGMQSTYVNKYEYQDYTNGPWNQNVGVFSGVGPIFKWQHNFSVNWSKAEYTAGMALHFKSGYVDQYGPPDEVASYTTIDVFGSWTPVKAITLTAGVRNIADRAPPLSFQDYVFQAGYDPRFTDPTGRAYYLRGTYNF
jgi:iron complex outermembrane receptor protein